MVMEIIVRWFIMCMHLILYMLGTHGLVTYRYMHYDIKTYFLQDAAAATRVCIGKVHGPGGKVKVIGYGDKKILCCATKKRVVYKMKVGDKKNDIWKWERESLTVYRIVKSGGKIKRW
eukprot:32782_1